jgi:hypothetical protein
LPFGTGTHRLLKAVEELDVGYSSLFLDLADGRFVLGLAKLDVPLGKVPVAGGIVQEKVFRLLALMDEEDCAGRPLVDHGNWVSDVVCIYFP